MPFVFFGTECGRVLRGNPTTLVVDDKVIEEPGSPVVGLWGIGTLQMLVASREDGTIEIRKGSRHRRINICAAMGLAPGDGTKVVVRSYFKF